MLSQVSTILNTTAQAFWEYKLIFILYFLFDVMNIQRNERQYNRYWHYQCNRDLYMYFMHFVSVQKDIGLLPAIITTPNQKWMTKIQQQNTTCSMYAMNLAEFFNSTKLYIRRVLNSITMKTTHWRYVGFACIYYRNLKTDRLIKWTFSFENNNFFSLFLFLIWDMRREEFASRLHASSYSKQQQFFFYLCWKSKYLFALNIMILFLLFR